MYPESIDKKTKRVFAKVSQVPGLADNLYLAGGTALAIQLGHRESIDLDFFNKEDFDTADIRHKLEELGKFSIEGEEDGTLHGTLDDVKVTFLRYNYDLLYPLISFEGINLADQRDIAAMKIEAISSRGSKKDFFDFFFLLKEFSLEELLDIFEKKYSKLNWSKLHLLKSLTYFKDAQDDPDPIMLKDANWEEVKEKIIKEVKKIS